jgi:hypothetical protein
LGWTQANRRSSGSQRCRVNKIVVSAIH